MGCFSFDEQKRLARRGLVLMMREFPMTNVRLVVCGLAGVQGACERIENGALGLTRTGRRGRGALALALALASAGLLRFVGGPVRVTLSTTPKNNLVRVVV